MSLSVPLFGSFCEFFTLVYIVKGFPVGVQLVCWFCSRSLYSVDMFLNKGSFNMMFAMLWPNTTAESRPTQTCLWNFHKILIIFFEFTLIMTLYHSQFHCLGWLFVVWYFIDDYYSSFINSSICPLITLQILIFSPA